MGLPHAGSEPGAHWGSRIPMPVRAPGLTTGDVIVCTETPILSCVLPASTEAPTFARDVVARNLCLTHAALAELPALMLVSELVAYAVVYGAPPFHLEVECAVRLLKIRVSAGWLPESVDVSDETELRDRIIHKVARSWGIERTAEGATYWCTLPTGAMPRQRLEGLPGTEDLPNPAN